MSEPRVPELCFLLSDGVRRPVCAATIAASSEVIKAAIAFSCGVERPRLDQVEYSLAEWPLDIAHAVIDVMCGTFDMSSEVEFDDWINMIALAHYLAAAQLSSIIRLRTRITDFEEWLKTAKMFLLPEMINVIVERNHSESFRDSLRDAMRSIDTADVVWYLDATDSPDHYDDMLVGAIISRETAEEQRQLIPFLTACVQELRYPELSHKIIDPVLRHVFRIMSDAID